MVVVAMVLWGVVLGTSWRLMPTIQNNSDPVSTSVYPAVAFDWSLCHQTELMMGWC